MLALEGAKGFVGSALMGVHLDYRWLGKDSGNIEREER